MNKIVQVNTYGNGKFSKSYKEVSSIDTSVKAKKRKKIQDIRGDLYDIVADSLKWSSLLTTLISRMYTIMPDEQKNKLEAGDKIVIEAFLSEFKNTDTRMDKQLVTDGLESITKLMEKERLVGELF